MADLPPDARGDTDNTGAGRPDRESNTRTPRWVTVFGIIALVVVVLLVIGMFTGIHDPSRWGH